MCLLFIFLSRMDFLFRLIFMRKKNYKFNFTDIIELLEKKYIGLMLMENQIGLLRNHEKIGFKFNRPLIRN